MGIDQMEQTTVKQSADLVTGLSARVKVRALRAVSQAAETEGWGSAQKRD